MKNKISAQNLNTGVDHSHQSGLKDSFKSLVTDQIPTLRRYAIALRGPIGDHDEIVRDTLEQTIKRKNSFSQDDDVRVWLLSILHDVYSTQYGNRMPTSSIIPLDIAFDASSVANPNNEDIDITDLDYALALLPEIHKEVFILVSLEGLSYKQVSRILDTPVGTLMNHLTQARKLIKTVVSTDNKL